MAEQGAAGPPRRAGDAAAGEALAQAAVDFADSLCEALRRAAPPQAPRVPALRNVLGLTEDVFLARPSDLVRKASDELAMGLHYYALMCMVHSSLHAGLYDGGEQAPGPGPTEATRKRIFFRVSSTWAGSPPALLRYSPPKELHIGVEESAQEPSAAQGARVRAARPGAASPGACCLRLRGVDEFSAEPGTKDPRALLSHVISVNSAHRSAWNFNHRGRKHTYYPADSVERAKEIRSTLNYYSHRNSLVPRSCPAAASPTFFRDVGARDCAVGTAMLPIMAQWCLDLVATGGAWVGLFHAAIPTAKLYKSDSQWVFGLLRSLLEASSVHLHASVALAQLFTRALPLLAPLPRPLASPPALRGEGEEKSQLPLPQQQQQPQPQPQQPAVSPSADMLGTPASACPIVVQELRLVELGLESEQPDGLDKSALADFVLQALWTRFGEDYEVLDERQARPAAQADRHRLEVGYVSDSNTIGDSTDEADDESDRNEAAWEDATSSANAVAPRGARVGDASASAAETVLSQPARLAQRRIQRQQLRQQLSLQQRGQGQEQGQGQQEQRQQQQEHEEAEELQDAFAPVSVARFEVVSVSVPGCESAVKTVRQSVTFTSDPLGATHVDVLHRILDAGVLALRRLLIDAARDYASNLATAQLQLLPAQLVHVVESFLAFQGKVLEEDTEILRALRLPLGAAPAPPASAPGAAYPSPAAWLQAAGATVGFLREPAREPASSSSPRFVQQQQEMEGFRLFVRRADVLAHVRGGVLGPADLVPHYVRYDAHFADPRYLCEFLKRMRHPLTDQALFPAATPVITVRDRVMHGFYLVHPADVTVQELLEALRVTSELTLQVAAALGADRGQPRWRELQELTALQELAELMAQYRRWRSRQAAAAAEPHGRAAAALRVVRGLLEGCDDSLLSKRKLTCASREALGLLFRVRRGLGQQRGSPRHNASLRGDSVYGVLDPLSLT